MHQLVQSRGTRDKSCQRCSAVLREVPAKPGLRAQSLSIAYRERLPADEERAASARRRMALRLLVELLCVGVTQDVAGVLGVLQGLVRIPANFIGLLEGSLAACRGPLTCCSGTCSTCCVMYNIPPRCAL